MARAYRFNGRSPEYVAQLPGDGGVDWGYTSKISKAIDLSEYWMRRFRNENLYHRDKAHFIENVDT